MSALQKPTLLHFPGDGLLTAAYDRFGTKPQVLAPPPWWTPDGVRLTGRVLAEVGLQVPVLFPERLVLVRATRV